MVVGSHVRFRLCFVSLKSLVLAAVVVAVAVVFVVVVVVARCVVLTVF